MKTLRHFCVLLLFILGMQMSFAQSNKVANNGILLPTTTGKAMDNKGTVSVKPSAMFDTLFSGAKSVQQLQLINGTNSAVNYAVQTKWPDKTTRARKYGDYADKNRKADNKKPLGKGNNKGINAGTKAFGDVLDTIFDLTYENGGIVVVEDTLFAISYHCPCVIKYNLVTNTVIGTFPIAWWSYSITYDGNYLWIGNSNGNVYAYTTGGTYTGYSFSLPISYRHSITWDGEYFLFFYLWSGPNPNLYRCDETGNVVETITTTLPEEIV